MEIYEKELDELLEVNRKYKNIELSIDNFLCTEMPMKLTEFDWIKRLKISNTLLDNTNNMPQNINYLVLESNNFGYLTNDMFWESIFYINLSNNTLNKIDFNIFPKSLKFLLMANCFLTTAVNINTLTKLDMVHLQNNGLASLDGIHELEKLHTLNIANNKFSLMPSLNENIRIIDISYNAFKEITTLPDTLTNLDCSACQLKKLILPMNLIILKAENNFISTINYFPQTLQHIFLGGNELTHLPRLPPNVIEVDVSSNKLTTLMQLKIPVTLEKVNITDNYINKKIVENFIAMNPHMKCSHDYEMDVMSDSESDNIFTIDTTVKRNVNYDNYESQDKKYANFSSSAYLFDMQASSSNNNNKRYLDNPYKIKLKKSIDV